MTPKIILIAVCYNSYKDTLELLKSIESSYKNACKKIQLTVIINDNSDNSSDASLLSEDWSFSFKVLRHGNLGYFPSFRNSLEKLLQKKQNYDYIIMCNVDLKISENFFMKLLEINLLNNCGIIAPNIISTRYNNQKLNPKIQKKITRKKLKILEAISSNIILFSLHYYISRLRNKNKKNNIQHDSIYAPHGAFVIFTKKAIDKKSLLKYPIFLFGEEIFLAEEMANRNLTIEYKPSLKVYDKGHGSISLKSLAFIAKHQKKSYTYLLKTYFN